MLDDVGEVSTEEEVQEVQEVGVVGILKDETLEKVDSCVEFTVA